MELIRNTDFAGERPLFGSKDLRLENVTVQEGESALKCCSNIEAVGCRFEGKYPFWHVETFRIDNCVQHCVFPRCGSIGKNNFRPDGIYR